MVTKSMKSPIIINPGKIKKGGMNPPPSGGRPPPPKAHAVQLPNKDVAPSVPILEAENAMHNPLGQAESALNLADQMMIQSSQYRQMGFLELARFLKLQAIAARKWAARQK